MHTVATLRTILSSEVEDTNRFEIKEEDSYIAERKRCKIIEAITYLSNDDRIEKGRFHSLTRSACARDFTK